MHKETSHILWLEQIGLADQPVVGGKAAVLGVLRGSGLPVPDGFCITAPARHEVEHWLWLEIEHACTRLVPNGSPVAVRSSAVGEDSPGASYAGQYATLLGVQGRAGIKTAVRRCWASGDTPRVRDYQSHLGRPAGDSRLAVLVQRQVAAQVSGVLFTRHPLSGATGQLLVEAVSGLGEALVAGHAAPAQYCLDRRGRILSSQDGEDLLSPEHCRHLASLAARIEQVLGPDQDIEWALDGGEIYILQARPVTGAVERLPLDQIWTRANVGEVLPGVVTPLTWSIFRATLLGGSSSPGEPLDLLQVDDEPGGIRNQNGRVYLRMDVLLDSFCYLPGVSTAVMAQVLGVDLPEAAEDYAPPRGPRVRLAQAAFFLDVLGMLPRLAWLAHRLPPPPLHSGGLTLLRWAADCMRLHLKATAYAISAYGLLHHWLAEEHAQYLPLLLLGQDDLQTAGQGRSLWRLTESILVEPRLQEILQDNRQDSRQDDGQEWPAVAAALHQTPGGAQFLHAFDAFLTANGARAAGEFELAIPRWREDPSFVLQVLRKYLAASRAIPGPVLDGMPSFAKDTPRGRQAAALGLQSGLNPLQRWLFNRLLTAYSRYTTLRENIKYRLMEGYAGLRQDFLARGAALAAAGLLADTQDIFFLNLVEILALEGQGGQPEQVRARVAQRKGRHAQWEAQTGPDLIRGDGHPIRLPAACGSEALPGALLELLGIGSSPGTATGSARVLLEPSQAAALQPGEILVAPHTDPGWTPLFLSCKAVVTEIGGFLSHGATVAREYGIPCVVNVRGATVRIRTGDWIHVDGTRGRVTLGKTG